MISSQLILFLMITVIPESNKTHESHSWVEQELSAETLVLGQLVGTWRADQEILQPTGEWKKAPAESEWRFYYILGGQGIQDDWTSTSVDADGVETKTYGTNIRIYNPEKKHWEMAWLDTNNRSLGIFTAKRLNGALIMEGHNAKGREVRNTFHDIGKNEFRWKQEWTFDEGKSWVTVSRIHCTRVN